MNNAGIIRRADARDECGGVAQGDRHRHECAVHRGKAVLPQMMEEREDHQHLFDDESELGRETVSAYAAAKGGLKMLTKTSAAKLQQVQHPVQRDRAWPT